MEQKDLLKLKRDLYLNITTETPEISLERNLLYEFCEELSVLRNKHDLQKMLNLIAQKRDFTRDENKIKVGIDDDVCIFVLSNMINKRISIQKGIKEFLTNSTLLFLNSNKHLEVLNQHMEEVDKEWFYIKMMYCWASDLSPLIINRDYFQDGDLMSEYVYGLTFCHLQTEISILKEYLPKNLNKEELECLRNNVCGRMFDGKGCLQSDSPLNDEELFNEISLLSRYQVDRYLEFILASKELSFKENNNIKDNKNFIKELLGYCSFGNVTKTNNQENLTANYHYNDEMQVKRELEIINQKIVNMSQYSAYCEWHKSHYPGWFDYSKPLTLYLND